MNRKPYPTDLTDAQWKAIEPHFNQLPHYKWDKRELVNAVLYITKSCPMISHHIQPYGVSIEEPINRAYGQNPFGIGSKKRLANK